MNNLRLKYPSRAGVVAFSAFRTTAMGPVVWDTPITYDVIQTKIGGGFMGDSSFIAPVAGVYLFLFNSRSGPDSDGHSKLHLNGIYKCHTDNRSG